MTFTTRRAIAGLLLLTAGLTANISVADELDDQLNQRPSAAAMTIDAVIARPMLFAGTLGGTALFVATLPFSALGGKVEEAANTLVVGLAKSTFTRCLGCTAMQDSWKNKPTTNEQQ
ncbi:hypothetical protein EV700_1159 [Fluviicoccus keumensis]|uniref:Multidrug transporter n=1 Tax=Fluviicoccus keumensis TaxID=1435465 RepID=A0A4Q7Z8E1_9GAMM|nr:hypothetical protein [Fluviicoccus keumensis]RZU46777.1 hypothetical protein EV700_1159 [Fluviicoccus keumensis]